MANCEKHPHIAMNIPVLFPLQLELIDACVHYIESLQRQLVECGEEDMGDVAKEEDEKENHDGGGSQRQQQQQQQQRRRSTQQQLQSSPKRRLSLSSEAQQYN